jgi:hypothetical protein
MNDAINAISTAWRVIGLCSDLPGNNQPVDSSFPEWRRAPDLLNVSRLSNVECHMSNEVVNRPVYLIRLGHWVIG